MGTNYIAAQSSVDNKSIQTSHCNDILQQLFIYIASWQNPYYQISQALRLSG